MTMTSYSKLVRAPGVISLIVSPSASAVVAVVSSTVSARHVRGTRDHPRSNPRPLGGDDPVAARRDVRPVQEPTIRWLVSQEITWSSSGRVHGSGSGWAML